MIPDVSRERIVDAIRTFDEEWRQSSEWADWESNEAHRYALVWDGERYPVKKILSLATGAPLSSFSGGVESNNYLRNRGFEVIGLREAIAEQPRLAFKDALEFVLSSYLEARNGEPFSGTGGVSQAFRNAAASLERSDPVRRRPSLKVVASFGKGNWAKVPWISLLDTRETDSTTRGVYAVYLFRQDMTGVYLTLNQGVTDPRERLGAAEGRSFLQRRAIDIRTQCEKLRDRSFNLDDEIDLRADAGLGASYEASTAAYKLYERERLPPESELVTDLEAVLSAYDHYLEARPQLDKDAEATAWIFQANPDIYDLGGAVKSLPELVWTARQHRARIQRGHRVYLWEAGKESGIVAVATILTDPGPIPEPDREAPFRRHPERLGNDTEPRVLLKIERVLPQRLTREALLEHPSLGSLTILRAPQATNFALTPEEAATLQRLVAGPGREAPTGMQNAASVLEYINSRGFVFEPWQLATYITALRTKPFVILAGVTGTGKSKLPVLVSEATGGIPQLIPVRPDWTDSSEVLGYVDLQGEFRPGPLIQIARRAQESPDRHFVCIVDEMNLARVEHYFAEVLSRVEDRRPAESGGFVSGRLYSGALRSEDDAWGRVVMPPNLAIVGTVNMDETTHGFSRKVLDRAFTIELSDVILEKWQLLSSSVAQPMTWAVESWYPRAIQLAGLSALNPSELALVNNMIEVLRQLNAILRAPQLQLGYRARDEIGLFLLHAREVHELFVTAAGVRVDPLDLALNLKVLPRIGGGTGPIRRCLIELLGWAWNSKPFKNEDEGRELLMQWDAAARPLHFAGARFPVTAARLCLMWDRLLAEGYTSFWL